MNNIKKLMLAAMLAVLPASSGQCMQDADEPMFLETETGTTPNVGLALHEAAKRGDLTAVEDLIILRGAYVNKQNSLGETPLHTAVQHNHAAIVEILLKAGAKPNIQENYNGTTALHCASWNGQPKIVEILLRAGADKDKTDKYGNTPLIWALKISHKDIVAILIKAGANVNQPNKNGFTPLDYAYYPSKYDSIPPERRAEIIAMLIHHGAIQSSWFNRIKCYIQ